MSTPIVDRPKNRFIDPKVLMKIQNLELIARTVVEGFVNGLHKSPYLGFSVDFAEYRQYMPGDDIRRIDASGRYDKILRAGRLTIRRLDLHFSTAGQVRHGEIKRGVSE